MSADANFGIWNSRPVRFGGRLAHEGYFPDDAPLVAKTQRQFEVQFLGTTPKIKKAILRLIGLGGNILGEFPVKFIPEISGSALIELKIPDQPFKIQLEGFIEKDKFQRMDEKLFVVQ